MPWAPQPVGRHSQQGEGDWPGLSWAFDTSDLEGRSPTLLRLGVCSACLILPWRRFGRKKEERRENKNPNTTHSLRAEASALPVVASLLRHGFHPGWLRRSQITSLLLENSTFCATT